MSAKKTTKATAETISKAVASVNHKLTAARLREVLRYEPSTGLFYWLIDRGPALIGDAAGSITQHGYIYISIDYQRYYAHRLAWLYVYGVWPNPQVDHINGRGLDNRIENIRECSSSENGQNLGIRRSNTSGLTGVHFNRARNKWVAQIRIDGKTTSLGRYETKERAHQVYLDAKRNAHDFQPIPRELIQC